MSCSYYPAGVTDNQIDALFKGSLPDDVIDMIELRDKINRDTVSYLESLRRMKPDQEFREKYGEFLDGLMGQLSELATDAARDSKRLFDGDYGVPSLRIVGGSDYDNR